LEAEELEQLVGPPPCASHAGTDSQRSDLDVLPHREVPERPAVLERPCETGALQRVIRRPASSTEPEVGRSNPVSTFTSVDFPAPFGPIKPTTSCRWSSSVTSWSARTPSNDRETEEARRVSPGLLSA
jgi:hypothetical protein